MSPPAGRPVAPLLALVLLVAACGSEDDGGAIAPADDVTTTTASEPSTTSGVPSETTTTAPVGNVIHVEVAAGAPLGGVQTVEVPVGDELTLRVTADVADEVHVHGYDLTADVAPGTPAELTFVADIPGQFEVELEEAGLLIVELLVA
jgi:nitrous oxide reductase